MNNEEFLKVVKSSFDIYLETGSRSNKKLKVLHGEIAKDLKRRLGDKYILHSLGYNDDKEVSMSGKYMDKIVDIAVEKDNEVIAAIALKFIMRNYSQNSNNYFENMLGETANIRSSGKPYFQIIIIPSKVPYFKKGGKLDHIETITKHNLSKYIELSNDDIEENMYIPNKTLIFLIDTPEFPENEIKDNDDYIDFYQKNNDFVISESTVKYQFGTSVIYNNYNKFMEEISEYIESI